MKKWLKVLIITLSSIIGLLLIILLVGSPIAKLVIEKNSKKWIGRQVEMRSLWINPFVGSVTINDLSCSENPQMQPNISLSDSTIANDDNQSAQFLQFSRLYVSCNLLQLIGKDVHLRHIWLEDFNGEILKQDSVFNFTDILDRFSSDDSEEPQDTTPSTWKIRLDDIRLKNGKLTYADLPTAQHWTIENISVSIPGLYFGDKQSDAGLSLDLPDNGGNLKLRAAYNMAQNEYSVILDLTDIDTNQALPFIQNSLNIRSLDAMLNGHLLASGNLNDIMGVEVKGSLSLEGLDMRGTDKKTIAELDRLDLHISKIVPKTMNLRFDSISIDGLSINFLREKDYTTLSRLLGTEDIATPDEQLPEEITDTIDLSEYDDATSQPAPRKTPIQLYVGNFQLSNSSVYYDDRTLFSPFKYTISDITARGKNLTLDGQNHMMISAHLPNGGSMMANWNGGLDIERDNARIVAMLKNVQLADLSPFVEYMFAYPVNEGTLSLTSDNTIRRGQLQSGNIIDILNFKLGKKQRRSQAAYKSVPLKLGVELMTDLNGKININLPIHGNINSPKFKLRKVIGRAISNILIKATAAPFVAMANANNIKADDLSRMEVDMLIPDFTLSQYQKLDLLAELMTQQPDIQLIMQQQFNLSNATEELALFNLKKTYYTKDKDALEEHLSLVDIENIKAIKTSNADFQAFAKELTGNSGNISQLATEYYGSDSIQSQLLKRAERHNQFLVRYLTEQKGIDKRRITVTTAPIEQLATFKSQPQYSIEAKMNE